MQHGHRQGRLRFHRPARGRRTRHRDDAAHELGVSGGEAVVQAHALRKAEQKGFTLTRHALVTKFLNDVAQKGVMVFYVPSRLETAHPTEACAHDAAIHDVVVRVRRLQSGFRPGQLELTVTARSAARLPCSARNREDRREEERSS